MLYEDTAMEPPQNNFSVSLWSPNLKVVTKGRCYGKRSWSCSCAYSKGAVICHSADIFIFLAPVDTIYAVSALLYSQPDLSKTTIRVVPTKTQIKRTNLTHKPSPAKPLNHSQSANLNVSVKQPTLDEDPALLWQVYWAMISSFEDPTLGQNS